MNNRESTIKPKWANYDTSLLLDFIKEYSVFDSVAIGEAIAYAQAALASQQQDHIPDVGQMVQSQAQQQDNQPVAWRLSYFKKGEKPATWNDNACDRPKLFLDEELAKGKLYEVHTFERIETAFIEPLYLQSQAQQTENHKAKIKAWCNTLEKAADNFERQGYSGESADLLDIKAYIQPLPPAPDGDKK